jgi:hypothetical protein
MLIWPLKVKNQEDRCSVNNLKLISNTVNRIYQGFGDNPDLEEYFSGEVNQFIEGIIKSA